MTIYYVATLARYVLVEAETESEARLHGEAALHELHTDLREQLGRDVPVNILVVRFATSDEIELGRWHDQFVAQEKRTAFAKLVGEPIIDAKAQAMTDWIPMSVPGREMADGTKTPTFWYAFNRKTRRSIEFSSFEEARTFSFHPENQR